MSNCFHGIALAEKISHTDISIINFEFFDDNSDLSPFSFKDNSITSLIHSINDIKLGPLNFQIGIELPILGDPIDEEFRRSLDLLILFFGRVIFL